MMDIKTKRELCNNPHEWYLYPGIIFLILVIPSITFIIIYNANKKSPEEIKKEKKAKEKKRQKEEKVSASEPSGGGLTGDITRLKKLYKNGTLTKAEFEKAKNKLLK